MEFEQIIKLINTVSDSKLTSFSLEEGDSKIVLKKGDLNKKTSIVQMPHMPQMPQMPQGAINFMPQPQPGESAEAGALEESKAVVDENLKIVNSPLVGTFYGAPSPDKDNFVKVGDRVKKGQVLGIIEAMKLMNDIESDFDGEIVEIMVNNQDMVEYGQPLFKIK